MNFSSVELLNRIEELANVLTTPKDIAIILEVEPKIFYNELKNVNSEVYKAFYKGYLLKDQEIKKKSIAPIDVDSAFFTLEQLQKFKSKLIIQLNG